jgi:hypothetical protein
LTAPAPRQPGGPHPAASRRPLNSPLQAGGSDERRPGYRWVGCDRCGAAVQVAKFSPQHTVVQWNPESVRACAEFAAGTADGTPSALIEGCASLRESIDRAVLQGRLEVSPP